MVIRKQLPAIAGLLLLASTFCSAQSRTGEASNSQAAPHPRIRTVTVFVRLTPQSYRQQVADALTFLHAAKSEYNSAGYEVETIRITSQPFPEIVRGMKLEQAVAFFREYDNLAQQEGFTPNIGGAMMRDSDDPAEADLLAQIIAGTRNINGFVAVADEAGIHWNGIRAAARVNKYLEEHTEHGEGNFRFAAGAFPPVNAPFFPVSHTSDEGHSFAVGIESAGIVKQAFASADNDMAAAGDRLTSTLGAEAKNMEEIARKLERSHKWKYRGIDLTPVPLKEVSIGDAMETLIKAPLGSPGSLSVAYTITSAVKRVPVMQTGYSGLMLPVLEDAVLARRWESGEISRDALMSYSSVCSAGLDAVPLPGDVTQQELERIFADMASLAVKWHKPLSARLLPAPGKKVGDMTDFSSPYLVNIRIRDR